MNRRVDALKAQGISPIDFGVGDPTVPTPEVARERVKAAVDERAAAGYPAYEGDLGFREAIAAWTKRRFRATLDPKTEVCVTIGSKEAVFNPDRCRSNAARAGRLRLTWLIVPGPG